MTAKSAKRGKNTSAVEIGNVSAHGFWLIIEDSELFLAFEKFPWFKEATIGKLLNVKLLHRGHLYWPDLDIDLALESIQHPERYPLVGKAAVSKVRESQGSRGVSKRKTKRTRKP